MEDNKKPMIAVIDTVSGTFLRGFYFSTSMYENSNFYKSAFLIHVEGYLTFLIKHGLNQ